MTTIEKTGRRYYLRGLPYDQRAVAKSRGAKWDPAERCWWTGKADVADAILAAASNGNGSMTREAPGLDATVAGRAKYKGRTYYIAGRVTHWDDGVDAITTRDGAKMLLYFRDGSSSFWAARDAVQIVKSYNRPQTIGGLRRFVEELKEMRDSGSGACPACSHKPDYYGSGDYDDCRVCGRTYREVC